MGDLSRARASLALLLLAGCSLAPRYERPAPPVADAYPAPAPATAQPGPTQPPAATGPAAAPPVADLGWRDVFGDARLRALLEIALAQNRDLRVAVLNVELARARYGVQRSFLYPELDATAGFTRARTPADQSPSGHAFTSSAWSVGAGVTAWELDFFGRLRNLKDAALESYLATDEARRSAQLSLVSDLASQYLAARALDEQIGLARQTLDLVQSSYQLARRSYEVGKASELDLRTAESQVQAARVSLAFYTQARAQADNALALLLGAPLPPSLPPPAPLHEAGILADLPPGLPSELLERRPDILSAEHLLKAANASIGAARAAFFPSITLTAGAGLSSADLTNLFDASSGAWSFAPRLTLPIFTAGRNQANLDAARAQEQIAVARYERAIQGAFREVADALVARPQLEAQIEAGTARVAANARRYELADLRYRKGVDSYLTVIAAQQDLYAAQQLLVQARLARLQNLVGLYRALGGGWLERTRTASAAPPAPPAGDGAAGR